MADFNQNSRPILSNFGNDANQGAYQQSDDGLKGSLEPRGVGAFGADSVAVDPVGNTGYGANAAYVSNTTDFVSDNQRSGGGVGGGLGADSYDAVDDGERRTGEGQRKGNMLGDKIKQIGQQVSDEVQDTFKNGTKGQIYDNTVVGSDGYDGGVGQVNAQSDGYGAGRVVAGQGNQW